jgi:hypothetical protein
MALRTPAKKKRKTMRKPYKLYVHMIWSSWIPLTALQEGRGFIADDDDDDDVEARSARRKRKKRKNREIDEELDEEDLDLIGIEVEPKEKPQVWLAPAPSAPSS